MTSKKIASGFVLAATLMMAGSAGAVATRQSHSRTARGSNRAPAAAAVASPAQAPQVQPSAASVSIISATEGSNVQGRVRFVGTGGGIALTGVDGLTTRDLAGGTLNVIVPRDDGARTTAQWHVNGGFVTLNGGGSVRVAQGELRVQRAGRSGWSISGGSLGLVRTGEQAATRNVHSFDDFLATLGSGMYSTAGAPAEAPAADVAAAGNSHRRGPASLSARTLAALDALTALAPVGSLDAIRQAAAAEVTIRNSETSNPALYSIPITGRRTVFVIDTSYSMRARDPAATDESIDPHSPPTKLDVARAELVKVLSQLPAGTMVNIVAFSAEVEPLWPEPRMFDDAALDEAIRWVSSLRPQTETETVRALRLADGMNPDQVVLVSDGRPTDRSADDNSLLGLADHIAARGARLDVIGIGPDQDAPFLDVVAGRGHGVAQHR